MNLFIINPINVGFFVLFVLNTYYDTHTYSASYNLAHYGTYKYSTPFIVFYFGLKEVNNCNLVDSFLCFIYICFDDSHIRAILIMIHSSEKK